MELLVLSNEKKGQIQNLKVCLHCIYALYPVIKAFSPLFDRVFDKIERVLKASQEAAAQLNNRATLVIVTCPVFTDDVIAFTTLVQVIQGTRQGRSLADLLALVDRIIYVTIYPACNINEMASLTSAKEVVEAVQAAVTAQIQQIQSILSHLQETTIAPSDLVTEQVKLHDKQ